MIVFCWLPRFLQYIHTYVTSDSNGEQCQRYGSRAVRVDLDAALHASQREEGIFRIFWDDHTKIFRDVRKLRSKYFGCFGIGIQKYFEFSGWVFGNI